jgi:hypothetical protein
LDASEHIPFKIFSHRHVALCQAIDDFTELVRVLSCEFDTNVRKLNPLSPIRARFRNEERALFGSAADFGTREELGQNIFMTERDTRVTDLETLEHDERGAGHVW